MLPKSLKTIVITISLAAGPICAQDTPPDGGYAASSAYPSNKSGAFFGGTLTFGQSRAVGESSPGVGWFSGIEAGYVAARNEWNRLETGLELGTGFANFKQKDGGPQISLPITFYTLAKFGYAYSIGEKTFGVLRLGAGPATAKYPAKGLVSGSAESLTGFKGLVAYDFVFPAGEGLELVAGFNVRFFSFTGDEVDGFQMNVPALNVAARYRL